MILISVPIPSHIEKNSLKCNVYIVLAKFKQSDKLWEFHVGDWTHFSGCLQDFLTSLLWSPELTKSSNFMQIRLCRENQLPQKMIWETSLREIPFQWTAHLSRDWFALTKPNPSRQTKKYCHQNLDIFLNFIFDDAIVTMFVFVRSLLLCVSGDELVPSDVDSSNTSQAWNSAFVQFDLN